MMEAKVIPLYVGNCFGWLHTAGGNRGAIICSAYGVEELCTHRFMRRLGCNLAAAGLPTLRFDYHGTGDSLGIEADPDRLNRWLDDIRCAISWMKEATGVKEVALIGFRLGALLAAEAAQKNTGISHLVLLDAPVSGSAYLREMKALGLLAAANARTSELVPEPKDQIEVAGFTLSAATCVDLKQIDFLKLSCAPAANILLAGKGASRHHDRIEAHLLSLDCSPARLTIPGYDELVWDSGFAELPLDAFHDVAKWLARDMDIVGVRPLDKVIVELSAGDWRERPVLFGTDAALFGMHCVSTNGNNAAALDNVILFVNHGANHHIGWARMHVLLAREFASNGIASFRMDISGVGDSPPQAGKQENQLYARHNQSDVYAAVDWLKRKGYRSVTVIGHCAGAHLGFFSAVRDPRISALVMLNLQRFFWARGESLELATRQSFRSNGWYWAGLRDVNMWRRLFKGQVNVTGIATAMMSRFWQRLRAGMDYYNERLLGKEGSYSIVGRWLRELSVRGTRVLFVYSASDGGLDEFEKYLGKSARRTRKLGNVSFVTINDADHNLTSNALRERYLLILRKYLAGSM